MLVAIWVVGGILGWLACGLLAATLVELFLPEDKEEHDPYGGFKLAIYLGLLALAIAIGLIVCQAIGKWWMKTIPHRVQNPLYAYYLWLREKKDKNVQV